MKRKGGRAYCGKVAVSARQLRMGIKVEREHTKSRKRARKIACDHLVEFTGSKLGYYTLLAQMERRLKRSQLRRGR